MSYERLPPQLHLDKLHPDALLVKSPLQADHQMSPQILHVSALKHCVWRSTGNCNAPFSDNNDKKSP